MIKKSLSSLLVLIMLVATVAGIAAVSANAEDIIFINYSKDTEYKVITDATYFAAEQVVYEENGWLTYKTPTYAHKQYQMGYTVDSNMVKAAINAANSDSGFGILQIQVRLDSAANTATGEDCSAQVQINIHDSSYTLSNESGSTLTSALQWVTVGETKTLMLDVSDVNPDDVSMVRLVAMNWSNVNPDTGAACGFKNVQVSFSPIYVSATAVETTTIVTLPIDYTAAQEIANLYAQIPGTTENDIRLVSQYQALEQFTQKYTDADTSTQNYLASQYGITTDIYGTLMDLYNEMPPRTVDDPNYTTTATTATTTITTSPTESTTPTQTVTGPTTTNDGTITYGDVDSNNTINSKDSLLLKKYLASWDVTINTATADVNADNTINSKDSLLLKRFLANWEVKLGKQ